MIVWKIVGVHCGQCYACTMCIVVSMAVQCVAVVSMAA